MDEALRQELQIDIDRFNDRIGPMREGETPFSRFAQFLLSPEAQEGRTGEFWLAANRIASFDRVPERGMGDVVQFEYAQAKLNQVMNYFPYMAVRDDAEAHLTHALLPLRANSESGFRNFR